MPPRCSRSFQAAGGWVEKLNRFYGWAVDDPRVRMMFAARGLYGWLIVCLLCILWPPPHRWYYARCEQCWRTQVDLRPTKQLICEWFFFLLFLLNVLVEHFRNWLHDIANKKKKGKTNRDKTLLFEESTYVTPICIIGSQVSTLIAIGFLLWILQLSTLFQLTCDI